MNTTSLISDRVLHLGASGIRRIFALAASMDDPIDLSIGQPDFAVPDAVRSAAIDAITAGTNGYTMSAGAPVLLDEITRWLKTDLGWAVRPVGAGGDGPTVFVTSGTSGALVTLFMATLDPGDECIIADPYFVSYPHLATMAGATAVRCDTYPDFRMTADRVEPLITDRTKFVLLNSPSNPCGVVLTRDECADLLELCRSRGVLLVTDEIYDEFCYPEAATDFAAGDAGMPRCPSPARLPGSEDSVLLIRGFGKTYGCTGWRLGYAAGPAPVLEQMLKLQQYTFVCAPSPLQIGAAACFGTSMASEVAEYDRRRQRVVERLSPLTEVATPGGAFYAFIKVPESMGMTGTQFVERCIEHNVLAIPGGVFSDRDTHFRISYATAMPKLERGLEVIAGLLAGTG